MSASSLGVAPSGKCLWGEGLVWLLGAVVCLLAAAAVQCPLARSVDGRICSVAPWLLPINCNFETVKRAVLVYHVSSAM